MEQVPPDDLSLSWCSYCQRTWSKRLLTITRAGAFERVRVPWRTRYGCERATWCRWQSQHFANLQYHALSRGAVP
eukprot:4629355-Pleurochrysis_carterae.AAC.1